MWMRTACTRASSRHSPSRAMCERWYHHRSTHALSLTHTCTCAFTLPHTVHVHRSLPLRIMNCCCVAPSCDCAYACTCVVALVAHALYVGRSSVHTRRSYCQVLSLNFTATIIIIIVVVSSSRRAASQVCITVTSSIAHSHCIRSCAAPVIPRYSVNSCNICVRVCVV